MGDKNTRMQLHRLDRDIDMPHDIFCVVQYMQCVTAIPLSANDSVHVFSHYNTQHVVLCAFADH